MDWKQVLLDVTAIVGGIAAIVAIVNGIYELQERRRKESEARAKAQPKPEPVQAPTAAAPAAAPEPTPRTPHPLSNLPAQPTQLIGRERELAELHGLLLRDEVHLVTLTGEAGIGKTRLALRAAHELIDHFPDGVFFVPLAPVTAEALVLPTIAQVLEVREEGGRPLVDMLRDHLRDKRVLLILDNFEQIVAAAPLVSQLLAAAPGLKVIATSREFLHLYGEHVFLVPPLALPDLHALPTGPDLLAALRGYESVQLFVARGQAAQADFALTVENARAVAELCVRLDGLPLALELAAARVRLLSPQAMLERLAEAAGSSSLGLLTGGGRDLPARQQTLRNTIAWSFDLLDPAEQALFQRLGVFAGGWTVAAAAQVTAWTGDAGSELLDALDSLAGKSLIRLADAAEPRFMMLQTIREYALELLARAGLADELRDAHAAWFAGLAERADGELYRAAQLEWLAKLDVDYENYRAALAWALQHGPPPLALRLAGNLGRYWTLRGRVSEGRGWLDAALEAADGQDGHAALHARALLGLGELASSQGDWPAAWSALGACVALARTLADRPLLARSLATLALFRVRGADKDPAATAPLAEESLEVARGAGDPWTLGYVLTLLDIRSLLLGEHSTGDPYSEEALRYFEEAGDRWGAVLALRHVGFRALAAGNYAAARSAAERSLEASRALGDRLGEAYTLSALGDIAKMQDDYEAAERYYQESLARYRELGLRNDIPASLHSLGYVALARGDRVLAGELQRQSLILHRANGNQAGMLEAVAGVAAVARATGDLARAARLFGAAEALTAAINAPKWPGEEQEHDRHVGLLRGALGEAELARAWAAGRALTLDEAVAEALDGAPAQVAAGRSAEPDGR